MAELAAIIALLAVVCAAGVVAQAIVREA